ncbi:MAG TPA: Rrf2 family transcriptional regulator [Myxococcota bacterium]|nr:Rrf2 family transcriptional regulator [Myxococcota bacterium]HRY94638.1 Rrf2 family transcriptional regulator [Myxococcota bacterium]HSA23059.1 Rrf2 family transcriptional regulator [Myxococcota bacterium]
MKLSKSTELALHGLFQLATTRPRQLLVAEMATAQHVSTSYLAKVFQRLARKGLVKSTRGKKGGFTLAREPAQITLADIVRAVEAEEPLFECLGPQRDCKALEDCLVHDCFKAAEAQLFHTLEGTSLGDLLLRNGNGDRAAWLKT